eukprot:CAMPEP_0206054346 /NCGR_PEP_ID=MMETSP1466-20131121/37850_1 /ASSEMBLY_ACC=CAM_ASM_001126 /TAXON_ID=44452 /ORGANISM="Pavlova gyrans, Strain CCMP608" /LENGTH=61 /DNA_ID=CAMNT_0053429549 /DNA_START=541 /DNA_END=723 /DNA_ORIENTATION=+
MVAVCHIHVGLAMSRVDVRQRRSELVPRQGAIIIRVEIRKRGARVWHWYGAVCGGIHRDWV